MHLAADKASRWRYRDFHNRAGRGSFCGMAFVSPQGSFRYYVASASPEPLKQRKAGSAKVTGCPPFAATESECRANEPCLAPAGSETNGAFAWTARAPALDS